jgi:hypothetical protein
MMKVKQTKSSSGPARRKKKRKTQDYMAKHSKDGSRTSREELAGN